MPKLEHNTMKPVALRAWIVRLHAGVGRGQLHLNDYSQLMAIHYVAVCGIRVKYQLQSPFFGK